MVIQGNNRFILRDEAEREIAGILLKEAHELEKTIKENPITEDELLKIIELSGRLAK